MSSVRRSTGSSAAIVAIAYLLPHSREPFTIAQMLDPGRTVAELRELQELTGDENGAQRVAWTETWERARQWLREKVVSTGADEEIDQAGNQWFTLPGASGRALRSLALRLFRGCRLDERPGRAAGAPRRGRDRAARRARGARRRPRPRARGARAARQRGGVPRAPHRARPGAGVA